MVDRVTLSNLILLKAGSSETIVDPDDDGRAASILRMAWDVARQGTIRGGERAPKWNFATRTVPLAARPLSATEKLAYGWAAAYPFAEAHLRLVDVGGWSGEAGRWKVQGGEILATERGALFVDYLVDVVETAEWDASFVQAFVARMVYDCTIALGGDQATRSGAGNEWRAMISAAAKVDAREDPPIESQEADWIVARMGGDRLGRFDAGRRRW